MQLDIQRPSIDIPHVPNYRLEQYLPQLNNCLSNYDVDYRYVGSVGRYAAINGDLPPINPWYGDRDIDVTILNHQSHDEATQIIQNSKTAVYPVRLEPQFLGKIIYEGKQTSIRYKDIQIPVDPKVFEMVEGNLGGVKIPTFRPETHFHLCALYGPYRQKDFFNLLAYTRQLATIGITSSNLAHDMYEPFHQLIKERERRYPRETTLGKIRWLYHSLLPQSTREQFKGIMKIAKRLSHKHYESIDGFNKW